MTTPSAAGPTGLSRARDVVTVVLVAAFAYAGTRYGAGFTPRGAAVFAAGCALVPYGLERLGAAQTRETGVLASLAGTVLIVFAILAERTGVIPEALGGVPEPTVVITPGYEPPGEALPGSPPLRRPRTGRCPPARPTGPPRPPPDRAPSGRRPTLPARRPRPEQARRPPHRRPRPGLDRSLGCPRWSSRISRR